MNKIINKSIDVTKRYFFMLTLMGMVVGFSAFRYSQGNLADSGWYSITASPSDPDNPSLQKVDAFEGTNPPSGECNLLEEETPCQAHLDMSGFSGTIDANTTVQDILNDGGELDLSQSADGYARRAD